MLKKRDVILVCPGEYFENVVVDKTVILQGVGGVAVGYAVTAAYGREVQRAEIRNPGAHARRRGVIARSGLELAERARQTGLASAARETRAAPRQAEADQDRHCRGRDRDSTGTHHHRRSLGVALSGAVSLHASKAQVSL